MYVIDKALLRTFLILYVQLNINRLQIYKLSMYDLTPRNMNFSLSAFK